VHNGRMQRNIRRLIPARTAAAVLALALLLPACATNPATGRTEFNIVSEEQELAMGKETHEEILGEFAVYDEKPELNAMVERIGMKIAAGSPRPNLPWTFTLLDTPMVNAFAAPGGYIYVTRGILERLNSEDELAGVIGHEVAHVAARHTANSVSRATLAEIGLMTAAILAGEENTEKYGAVAMIGAGLLFARYSRGQETQADVLGTGYMAHSGWNPRGSENMLQALLRLEGGSVGSIERYFMDHPDPHKRVEDVRREIATLETTDATVTARSVNRGGFIRALDGMVTGNSTLDTTVRKGVVYNRSRGIVARPPDGWRAAVEPGSLFAFYPEQEATAVVYAQELTAEEIQEYGDAQAAVRAQLEEVGFKRAESKSFRSDNGQRGTIDNWSGQDDDGTKYYLQSAQRRAGDGAVVLLHISGARGESVLTDVLSNLEIDDDGVAEVDPPRLRVATARKGDTWRELARRTTGNPEDADDLAHINGFDFPSEIPAGMVLKLPQEIARE
jgi:predicted Zn-dependent protease